MCVQTGCKKLVCRCVRRDLTGQIAIVTGCSTGIGLGAVKALYGSNGKVYMACRSADKTLAAKDEIVAEVTGKNPDNLIFMKLDLASFESVRTFVAEFKQRESKLHILMNNAGITTADYVQTRDGLELTFQTNYFGHFLLTNELMDVLKSSAPSRIINVSSLFHKHAKGDSVFKGFKSETQFDGRVGGIGQYNRTKMAQILHMLYASRRLVGTGVTFNATHPGYIKTHIAEDGMNDACIGWRAFYRCLARPLLYKDVKKGYQCGIHVLLCPELENVSGKYFSEVLMKAPSLDPDWEAKSEKLYHESLRVCSIKSDALANT